MTHKRAVIIQPCFFPWRGQFDLISRGDITILLDTVQYSHGTWFNRNRIVSQHGSSWITVPVLRKGKSKVAIKDIQINNNVRWKSKILNSIFYEYSKTPYFETYYDSIATLINNDWTLLVDIAEASLLWTMPRIDLSVPLIRASSMDIDASDPVERLILLCQAVGATRYLSGPSAQAYCGDGTRFASAGIQLEWMEYNYPDYPQTVPFREHPLSILDLLFNTGPDAPRYIWRCIMNEPSPVSHIMQRTENSPLPSMIILDVTNVCNLGCIHCPQPSLQADPAFKARHFSFDYCKKIVDEIRHYNQPCLLRLTGDGEPLVNPKTIDMIQYACENCGDIVNLTTNGILLTPPKIDRLLETGIHLIDISIDALTKPVYELIRRGGNFERLLGHIFYLLDRIKTKNLSTKVMISFVVQKENAHESDSFRQFWKPLVDSVLIRSLHSATGRVKQSESRELNRADTIERYPCPHLWKRLTIDFQGRVKFCAHDWSDETAVVLGNIQTDSLHSIWTGVRLAEIRAQHIENRIHSESICAECTDWASSKWDFGYERLVDKVVYEKPVLMPEYPSLPDNP